MLDPALTLWIEAHYARLLDYARYQCYEKSLEAEDLLQEVLTQVCEGRIKVDLAKAPLAFLQHALRSRQRDIPYVTRFLWMEPGGRPSSVYDEYLHRWIDDELNERQRNVIRAFLDGCIFPAQLAKRTGYTIRQVKRYKAQGVARLKARAQDHVASVRGDDPGHADNAP